MKLKSFLVFLLILIGSFGGAAYSISTQSTKNSHPENISFFSKAEEKNETTTNSKIQSSNSEIKQEDSSEKKNENIDQKIAQIEHGRNSTISNFQQDGFADLSEKLMPSVVSIIASKKVETARNNQMIDRDLKDFLDRFFSMPGVDENQENNNNNGRKSNKEMTFGSGFVISQDGYVVTNNHVIEDAEEVIVKFNNDKQFKAKIIGRDEMVDLALLKIISKKTFDFVKFTDSDKIKIGNWAIAIGNPFGLGGSVSVGVISAISRDINAGPYDNFIQTDAAINRGHSGGPLFNIDGNVIGINTAIISPSGGNVGIGFAIPSNLAVPIIENLKSGKKPVRGYVGVKVQMVNQEMANAFGLKEPYGALVIEVVKDSPAEQAGLKPGDLILEFNGQIVKTMRILPRMIASATIGEFAKMKIISNGSEKEIKIKILENTNNAQKIEHKTESHIDEKNSLKIKDFGLSISNITADIRNRLAIKDNIDGVIVISISQNSPAENSDIQKFDIIQSVNQKNITNISEFESAIKNKKSLLLEISRNGAKKFVTIEIQDEEAENNEK